MLREKKWANKKITHGSGCADIEKNDGWEAEEGGISDNSQLSHN